MRNFKELMKIKEVKEALNQECEIDITKETLTIIKYCDETDAEHIVELAEKAKKEGITKENATNDLEKNLMNTYKDLEEGTRQMIADSIYCGFITKEEGQYLNKCVCMDFSEHMECMNLEM